MSGEVVHFEVPADDVDRARKFYRKTFGWQLHPEPDMDYTLVSTAASDDQGRPKSPGAINGGLTKRQSPIETPVITIRVEDIDAIGKTIEKNGGKVIRSKETIGDGSIGFAAYFRDTEGNVVGLFQSARR